MRKTIGALMFGVLFAVVGYFVAFHFGKSILDNAKASEKWPAVDGVIARSEVVTSRGDKGETMYAAEVLYKYTVGDREYQCDNVYFGGDYRSSSSSGAYDVVRRYPVGDTVKVHYEPDKPENAVLEPGVTWMSYLVYGIGLVFFIIGLLLALGPICYFALAGLIVGGAAGGAIGRRRKAADSTAFPTYRDSGATPAPPMSQHDRADDGIDIG